MKTQPKACVEFRYHIVMFSPASFFCLAVTCFKGEPVHSWLKEYDKRVSGIKRAKVFVFDQFH